jgi:hypothetical protein
MEEKQEEFVVIFEAPKLVPPEFRLYYDDKGKVITYTCEKLEGDNYIVIDAATFAQARPDIRVINGKISTVAPNAVVSKVMPSEEGISCPIEDISIVVNSDYKGKKTKWKMVTYELN